MNNTSNKKILSSKRIQWIIGGIFFLGTLFDAISNSVQIISPTLSIRLIFLVIILTLITRTVIHFYPITYTNSKGDKLKIKRFGPKIYMWVLGVIICLSFPLIAPKPIDNDLKNESLSLIKKIKESPRFIQLSLHEKNPLVDDYWLAPKATDSIYFTGPAGKNIFELVEDISIKHDIRDYTAPWLYNGDFTVMDVDSSLNSKGELEKFYQLRRENVNWSDTSRYVIFSPMDYKLYFTTPNIFPENILKTFNDPKTPKQIREVLEKVIELKFTQISLRKALELRKDNAIISPYINEIFPMNIDGENPNLNIRLYYTEDFKMFGHYLNLCADIYEAFVEIETILSIRFDLSSPAFIDNKERFIKKYENGKPFDVNKVFIQKNK